MDRPRATPYHWWGDAWARPNPRSLEQLVSEGALTAAQARELAHHVSSGGSVVVASPGPGAGKSTLAHALIDHCPAHRQRIYVRGNQESFTWADEIDPDQITLLVNEISPHLPVYHWGAAVDRLRQLIDDGAQIITTAHASSAADLRAIQIASGLSIINVVAPALVVALNETLRTATGLCPVKTIERIGKTG